MNIKIKIALACYITASLILAIFALIYLLQTEYMPYHAAAVEMSWSSLNNNFQVLFLAMMKVMGGSTLALALAMLTMIFNALQTLRLGLLIAIPICGLIASLTLLYVTLNVAHNTPGTPPWGIAATGSVLLLVGLFLCIVTYYPRFPVNK